MEILDRIPVSNDVFIKSVLAQFAKARNLPATAVSEMMCAGVTKELFEVLGATEEMALEYIHSILGRMPLKMRSRIKISEGLSNFMANRVSPGLLHKYNLKPDELFVNWNFDCLDDVSTMERLNLGASVECEHHEKWKKAQKEEMKEKAREATVELRQESPGELDSLLTL